MSRDQPPPEKQTRKPRFFALDEIEPQEHRAAPKEAVQPVSRDEGAQKEQIATQKQRDHPEPDKEAPPPPSHAEMQGPLHQPRDKRPLDEESQTSNEIPDDQPDEGDDRTTPTLRDVKRGFRWTAIGLGAAGALAAMAFTSWLHSHIAELMAREDWIGWLALALVFVVFFALVMIALREFLALRRLDKIGTLREGAERAIRLDDRKAARKYQLQISDLFHGRPSLSWGLAGLKELQDEVLVARDRLTLVERNLMAPLDKEARKIVADSAKRVSVMTAISPFVFLDMLMVGVENFRMLRRLMSLYGGRPGLFSQFRLIRMMIANLALSGGVAVGADLIGHVMGRQVATRLAGRIGEGMINGSLTARLGITATRLIRPLPYIEAKPASITAFVKELTRGSKKK